MEIGSSLFLIAVGAILTFAVDTTISGLSIHTVGLILMIVGVIGLLITLFFLMPRRRAAVYDDRPVTTRREYY